MKATHPTVSVRTGTKRTTVGLTLAVALLFPCSGALAQPNETSAHFEFSTAMTNTTVNPNARGYCRGKLNRQGNANYLWLKVLVANLDPDTTYELKALIGDDTTTTSVTGFTTGSHGAFTVTYMRKGGIIASRGRNLLPDALSPICSIRELDIVNGSGQTVLRSDLTNPDKLQYQVNSTMTNSGFIPAAAGSLRIKATATSTQFRLQASGLMPSTAYLLAINGNVAQTNTTGRTGKLNLTALPPDAPDVLGIYMLALTDITGSNVVLSTEGLGVPCDTAAPTVTSTVPTNGATGAAIHGNVTATFNKLMDPLTITNATFTVKRGVTPVAGTVAYTGVTAIFHPTTALPPSTNFTATITTGARDLAGNALAADYVWNFTTSATADTTPPTVSSTVPTNGATDVRINQIINVTFSESMDALTIANADFTLTGPGPTTLTGTVTYVAASNSATFAPASSLLSNSTYTGTITTGVKDLSGNALATNHVWSFTTGTEAAQAPINLGSASTFAVMATAAITGGGDQINGDVGVHPGSAQGIPPSEINGTSHVNDQAVVDAQSDLLAAYQDAVSRSVSPQLLEGNLGGLTKTPGLYENASSSGISGTGPNGILTLDAQGDANAIFIFKMGSTFITDPGTSIVLSGNAKAKNVFWQVGSSATLNTTTIFKGNILAAVTITVNNGCDVEGRLFAGAGGGSGSVTVQASTITTPAP